MDKRTLKHLERLFAAEVEAGVTGRQGGVQLHPKTAARLEAEGLIQRVQHTSRDRLGTFTWETHELTHAGRYAYCSTCEDEPA